MIGFRGTRPALWIVLSVACSSGNGGGGALDGGAATGANGGKGGSGGTTGSGGTSASGGTISGGGTPASGGTTASGGTSVSGGTTSGGSAGAGGAAGSGGGSGGTDGGSQCLASGTAVLCIACCSTEHASWEKAAPATRDCVCVSPGTCKVACSADYCQGQPGSQSCYDCIFPTLKPGAACDLAAKQACGNDADCLAYVACREACTSLL